MTFLSRPQSDPETCATQFGFTHDAIATMTRSVEAGGGRMAQFDHPEFGGAGQWMRGGMLMIADFSNHALRDRVARLCEAIAQDVAAGRTAIGRSRTDGQPGGGHHDPQDGRAWWPAALGRPETSGAQNDLRYAWFAHAHRLAIDVGGTVTLYDTGEHVIGGVSQQQGGHRTLAFTSQLGTVDLARLSVVAPGPDGPESLPHVEPVREPDAPDPFLALEKLAALHAKGVIADDEFAAKKAELLQRI